MDALALRVVHPWDWIGELARAADRLAGAPMRSGTSIALLVLPIVLLTVLARLAPALAARSAAGPAPAGATGSWASVVCLVIGIGLALVAAAGRAVGALWRRHLPPGSDPGDRSATVALKRDGESAPTAAFRIAWAVVLVAPALGIAGRMAQVELTRIGHLSHDALHLGGVPAHTWLAAGVVAVALMISLVQASRPTGVVRSQLDDARGDET